MMAFLHDRMQNIARHRAPDDGHVIQTTVANNACSNRARNGYLLAT